MEIHFRPQFERDLSALKGKKAVNISVHQIIRQVEKATQLSQITTLKKLIKYEVYYRIKLK